MTTRIAKQIPTQEAKETFDGYDVRTPDGRYIINRVLQWAGNGKKWTTTAQAKVAWNHIKKARPEFVSLCLTYSTGQRGRPAETLNEEGMYQLLMALECEKAADFRAKAAVLVKQHREDAQRDHRQDPRWIRARADSKGTLHPLNDQIQDCGGTNSPRQNTYAIVHAGNDRLVTGKSMQTLRRQAGEMGIRDTFSTAELGKLITAQHLETTHLRQTKPHGHDAIIESTGEVTEALAAVFRRFEGAPEKLPRGTVDTFAPLPSTTPTPQALPAKRRPDEAGAGQKFFQEMRERLDQSDPEDTQTASKSSNQRPWERHMSIIPEKSKS